MRLLDLKAYVRSLDGHRAVACIKCIPCVRAELVANHANGASIDQMSKSARFSLGSFRRKERKAVMGLDLSAPGAILWNILVSAMLLLINVT